MNSADKDFLGMASMVIGAIALFGVVAFFIAGTLSEQIDREPGGDSDARIAPVGKVAISGVASSQPVEAAAPAEEAAAPMSGSDVFTKACFACHGTGVAGAPKVGDSAAWSARIAKGIDTLVKHATNGFQGDSGMMPPKGGHPYLTDENIHDAVQHMIDQSS